MCEQWLSPQGDSFLLADKLVFLHTVEWCAYGECPFVLTKISCREGAPNELTLMRDSHRLIQRRRISCDVFGLPPISPIFHFLFRIPDFSSACIQVFWMHGPCSSGVFLCRFHKLDDDLDVTPLFYAT